MTNAFLSSVKRLLVALRDDARGAVFIFVGIGLVAAIAATMLAVEVSHYTKVKTNFRNAVDQALLAAAARNSGTRDAMAMQATALEYLKANISSEVGFSVTDFRVSQGASGSYEWVGVGTGKLDTQIAQLFGISSLSIDHEARVGWDTSTLTELVAMVDMGGTMCARFDRTPDPASGTMYGVVPDRTCRKLTDMREALKQIVETGIGVSPNGTPLFKLGLVPFTYKVSLPNPRAVPNFLINAEVAARAANPADQGMGDPNYFTDISDAESIAGGRVLRLPPVMPLRTIATESDKRAYLQAVNNLVTNDPANNEFNRRAWKRSSLGAQISGLMLDPRYHAMFGGEKPSDFGTPKQEKVVIMMTDAANIGCCFTNWPEGNFRNNYLYSYAPDHKHVVNDGGVSGVCQQMKDAGIKVYTVLLDVDEKDMNERGGEIVQAFEQCATEPKYAYRVAYGDTEALKDAYTRIASSLVKLKLTY